MSFAPLLLQKIRRGTDRIIAAILLFTQIFKMTAVKPKNGLLMLVILHVETIPTTKAP